jgi:hypothetical protein
LDGIFDRLGNLLKSFLQDGESDIYSEKDHRFSDPDMQDAWSELDDYLKTGTGRPASTGHFSGASGYTRVPEEYREDFANLEIDFGAGLAVVKKAYKKMIKAYHPDRHAEDPEKSKTATEITKKLNFSYNRIVTYYENGQG